MFNLKILKLIKIDNYFNIDFRNNVSFIAFINRYISKYCDKMLNPKPVFSMKKPVLFIFNSPARFHHH